MLLIGEMRALPIPSISLSDAARFWAKVYKTDSCWLWTGALDEGYGRFSLIGRRDKSYRAHRIAYALAYGDPGQHLDTDHLCRNRACVNPVHLRPITTGDNVLAGNGLAAQNTKKTHCAHGHAYTLENTRIWRGHRYCRECVREKYKETLERKRQWRIKRRTLGLPVT
jgi:hypothetical protein